MQFLWASGTRVEDSPGPLLAPCGKDKREGTPKSICRSTCYGTGKRARLPLQGPQLSGDSECVWFWQTLAVGPLWVMGGRGSHYLGLLPAPQQDPSVGFRRLGSGEEVLKEWAREDPASPPPSQPG